MILKHNDCLNFCSIDAAKGICRLTKEFINIDSCICKSLVLAPKCGNCKNFKISDNNGIGICKGLEHEDWTFSSLSAITCRGHELENEE